MGNQFEGQVAVITGAGAGLGLSIAKRLASEGAQVAMVDLQREVLEKAVTEVGGSGRIFPCNVTDEAAVGALV
ncbi:MAG: SDR family NAD(P)-dependent oxidoreductase, partial [Acidobacteriota bacterium]